ncbi:dynein regulatory complex subunit 2 isoform X1 [Nasonia vitripennis]|uniref:Dynein regulatory complex subunit 2 n=1 Tax=Nasonia vitripennis TaxID=7425 RepID=A0A7M7IT59_NASVI|nr:dynein regulatory complex subunit 2 isoform X1 [Nasonia vitripennis]XP_016842771.1 dynein regulatory complex subunit 2 isoform X1 [Nasonia vitripennis]XP_032456497.1 dynein regulatory complex subunit 2 isoform X1 [Nasonia vitripennis]
MKKRKGRRRKRGVVDVEERQREAKRQELRRELEMGDTNARRLRKTWREKMMSLNLPVIKEDLQVAWRTFDRALDNKNYSISILLDALDDAEEQKRNDNNLQMYQIDGLIKVYEKHLNESNDHYRCSIEKTLDSERELIDETSREQEEKEAFLRTVIFSTKQGIEESIEVIQTKNLSKLDTRKEENDNIRRMSESLLKRRLHNFSGQLAGVLSDYDESTKDRRKDFEAVREKDEADQRVIARQSMRIEKLYNGTVELRNQIANFKVNAGREVADYTFERDYFYEIYMAMQKRLRTEQTLDREQLRILTVEYNITLEFLRSNLTKVEKILIMADLCQKYETYKDKVLLYPLSTVIENNETEDLNVSTLKPMQKLIKLVLLVQKNIKELKAQLEYHKVRFDYLKHSLKMYMELANPIHVCKKENSKATPVLINPKDVIKKCDLKVIDANDSDSNINLLLNKTF